MVEFMLMVYVLKSLEMILCLQAQRMAIHIRAQGTLLSNEENTGCLIVFSVRSKVGSVAGITVIWCSSENICSLLQTFGRSL